MTVALADKPIKEPLPCRIQLFRMPLDAHHGQVLTRYGLHHSVQRPLDGLPPRCQPPHRLVVAAVDNRCGTVQGVELGIRPDVGRGGTVLGSCCGCCPCPESDRRRSTHLNIAFHDRSPTRGSVFLRPTPPTDPLSCPAPHPVCHRPHSPVRTKPDPHRPRPLRSARHSGAAAPSPASTRPLAVHRHF